MPDNHKRELLRFNDFLRDIYDSDVRISGILSDNGVAAEKIALLKDELLGTFFEYLEFAFQCRLFSGINGRRAYQIVVRRYGLFGYEKETLQAIGERFGVSRERVRQLEKKTITHLRAKYNPTAILITLAACKTLNIDPIEILAQNIMVREPKDEENR